MSSVNLILPILESFPASPRWTGNKHTNLSLIKALLDPSVHLVVLLYCDAVKCVLYVCSNYYIGDVESILFVLTGTGKDCLCNSLSPSLYQRDIFACKKRAGGFCGNKSLKLLIALGLYFY